MRTSYHYCMAPGCADLIPNTIESAFCGKHRRKRGRKSKVTSPYPWIILVNFPSNRRSHYRETFVIQQNLIRAREIHAPATLTLDQWLFTLDYFQWKCAYCKVQEYAALEHFIPISWGGGTTQDNCVPACQKCNAHKSSHYPLMNLPEQLTPMKNDLKRVGRYLQSLREQTVIQLPLFP